MEDFWKVVEEEIDQMTKVQKIIRLVIIIIAIIGLGYAAGIVSAEIARETINLVKGKI